MPTVILMRARPLIAGILVLVLCIMSFGLRPQLAKAAPSTITVPDDYPTIQQAIDAAHPGDTVFVRNGTYHENVFVNKSLSLVGESDDGTIIDGGHNDTVVKVSGRRNFLLPLEDVTIANLTIRNSGNGTSDSGLMLDFVDYCNITNVQVVGNNAFGIWLNDSWYNLIEDSLVGGNKVFSGIVLTGSGYNDIEYNDLTDNGYGIVLTSNSSNNYVDHNYVANSTWDGVYIDSSHSNTVYSNLVTNSGRYGVFLAYSSLNEVSFNSFTESQGGGIVTDHSLFNFVHSNEIFRNNIGAWLYFSDSNTFQKNDISENFFGGMLLGNSSSNSFFENNLASNGIGYGGYGFRFSFSSGNSIFHNNIISNSEDVNMDTSVNTWDNASMFSEGGNYWTNYTGVDSNRDAIGDTPHVLDANNTDHYPLMGLYSSYNFSKGTLMAITNSTIQDLNYFTINSTVEMHVSNMTSNQTSAFARFALPYTMMNVSSVRVFVDNGTTPLIYYNYLVYDNGTHRWIYIVFPMSTHQIDILPALSILSILSPENKSYTMGSIPLSFTLDGSATWIGYSLDGQVNVSISGNTTLNGLPDRLHSIVVYANNTFGETAVSTLVDFTVDTTAPNITNVVQAPAVSSVGPQDTVKINATVTDALSGVDQVILNYTNGNGTWITVNMTNMGGNLWSGSIPASSYNTQVNYTIIASDIVGNRITTEETLGYQYQYLVVPEFPSFVILPIFMVALLLAIVVYRRKSGH